MRKKKEPDPGFAIRLRDVVVKAAGNNVTQFARILGVNQSLVNKYVQGATEPGLAFFQKLAREFPETDLRWLLTGQVKKTKNDHIRKSLNNYVSRLSQVTPRQLESALMLVQALLETQLKLRNPRKKVPPLREASGKQQ